MTMTRNRAVEIAQQAVKPLPQTESLPTERVNKGTE